MRAEIKEIRIDTQAIQSTLIIGVWLEFDYYIESPISIKGRLLTNNKVLSTVNEFHLNASYELALKGLSRDEKEKLRKEKDLNRYFAQLTAVLTPKAIEYIEKQRNENTEKSVKFSLEMIVKYLEFSTESRSNQNNFLIDIKVKEYTKSIEIKQSEWVTKYSPYLGIGNFLLIELELPNKQLIDDDWADLYDRLYQRLKDMELTLQSGDWYKTLMHSRQFIENLKFDSKRFDKHRDLKNALKELFLKDQHSEQGFDDFYNGIFYFFNYTSKFIHDKSNKTGELNKIPIPTKEDAYFIYTLGVGLLNIIGKKISKGSR